MTVTDAAPATWSKTQVAALKECRRKFFLNLKSAEQSDLAALKKLKNRHLWTGGFLHDEIGTLLKSVRQGDPVPETEALIAAAREKMRAQFKTSRDDASHVGRLFEHAYRITLSSAVWQQHWDNVEKGLRWFVGSKWLARLASLGPECWKAVDEILAFDVGGVKAYAKIDCAVETNGRFYLLDWKSSNPTATSEDGLQIGALYAHEVWGAEANQIEAVAISVLDGKTYHANVDEDSLMQTYLRVEEEAAVLSEARAETEASELSAIAMPAHVDVCRRCCYQKVCHPQGL